MNGIPLAEIMNVCMACELSNKCAKLEIMNSSKNTILQSLGEIVGEGYLAVDDDSLQRFGKDWTKAWQPKPLAIVFPANVDEVVAITRLANDQQFSLVPSGGRTGLSGGAVAKNGEVVIAMDRLNTLTEFSAIDRQVLCGAGVVTQQLQQFAEDQDLFYPVDFASSGSSQIGGNVATNAGGIKVIRYGMTRNWVKGLKVVTGSGEVLELNNGLTKNATGYDFRHLFIGSEGTLGSIVEVLVGLTSAPKDPTVLVLGVQAMPQLMEVLTTFQNDLQLTAFEFFSHKALTHVMQEKSLQAPFATVCDYYALLEFENDSESTLDTAMKLFERCVESGWVEDGTMSQNTAQATTLWRLREDISETISRFTPYKNDISVKVSDIPLFLREVDELVSESYPDFEIIWFGHIGDGNVHLNILKPANLDQSVFFEQCAEVSQWVFELVQKYRGSISAEHGVGLLKQPYLHFSRSDTEIELMRAMKRVFDPNGIMNPGKLL